MTEKDRQLLFEIAKAIEKLIQPPPTTFAPTTGEIESEKTYQPAPPALPPLPPLKG